MFINGIACGTGSGKSSLAGKIAEYLPIQFIEQIRGFADLIVPGGVDNLVAINVINTIIKQKIKLSAKR